MGKAEIGQNYNIQPKSIDRIWENIGHLEEIMHLRTISYDFILDYSKSTRDADKEQSQVNELP